MNTQPLFALYDQNLGYNDQPVLQQLNLTIQAGEKVALIGESGAGKSTLLLQLYRQRPEQCALLPQQLGLVPLLSLFHNIYIGRLQSHNALYNLLNLIFPQPAPRAEIANLASQLGLESKLWHSVDRLSGGQQQRVALGRALYRHCPIFIGDEPVSSLDPLQARELLKLIIARHSTVIVALHSPELAISLFDRVIALKAGRVQLDQPSAQLSAEQLSAIYHP